MKSIEEARALSQEAIVNGFRRRVPLVEKFAAAVVDYVLAGVIPARSLGVITGQSGSGKTTVATSMAIAVSQGLPWCGREVIKSPVVFLDRENGIGTTKARLKQCGLGPDGNGNGIYWAGQWIGEAISADDEGLIEFIKASNPKPLVFIDSFVAHHEGVENSADDVRKTFQKGRNLTALGAAVVYIHHVGKDEKSDYRGSSDFKAAVDFAYKCIGAEDRKRSGWLTGITLENFKWRDEVESAVSLKVINGGELAAGDQVDAVDRPTMKAKPYIEKLKQALIRDGKKGLSKNAFMIMATSVGGASKREAIGWLDTYRASGDVVIVTNGVGKTAAQMVIWKECLNDEN